MNQKTILLVEDDFLNRRLTKKVLLSIGHEVLEAKSAEIAIELLNSQSIDLAILDINLGDGAMSGISLGKQIQETFSVPFFYLTAYDNPQTINEAIATSPYSYLTKPFKKTDLIAAVEIALFKFAATDKQPIKILVKDGGYKVELHSNNINYIESDGNYLLIQTDHKIYKFRSTISQILEILPASSFVQIHRAFVVNSAKIEKFNSKNVFVRDTALPFSQKYLGNL